MVSPLFRKDYEAMTAAGVKFTLDEIIRLNALALKAKLAAKPFKAMHLPRCVFLDEGGIFRRPLILREPTIAHLLWLEEIEGYADNFADLAWYALCAFALSRDADLLPPPYLHRDVNRAVARFARRLLGLTKSQLCDAVDFALNGADWMTGENPPSSAASARDLASEESHRSLAIGVIVSAVAHRLPLSLADVKSLTESQLIQAMLEAKVLDDEYSVDAEHNKALADYFKARDEVKMRVSEEQS